MVGIALRCSMAVKKNFIQRTGKRDIYPNQWFEVGSHYLQTLCRIDPKYKIKNTILFGVWCILLYCCSN